MKIITKIRKLFAIRKEQNMEENSKKSVPEEKLKQVTGGGAFDDVPTVDEHNYDDSTRTVSAAPDPWRK